MVVAHTTRPVQKNRLRDEQDRSPLSPLFFSLLFLFFQHQHSSSAREVTSLLALFSCPSLSLSQSLAPVRPGCSLSLISFPSFSLFPTPVDRISPNRCLKARHKADSFEPAEWSERLPSRRSGWLGAAAAGSIPAFSTFFSLLFLFFQRQHSSSAREIKSQRKVINPPQLLC